MPETKTVELMTAWAWDCPNPTCDKRNLVNGIEERELTPEELEQIGLADLEVGGGHAVSMPEEVTCASCLTSYPVKFEEDPND